MGARKGRGGGYRLARDPGGITVGDVLSVLDGPVAPIPCASRSAYRPCADCPDEASCAVRRAMIEVRDAIAAVLDSRSIAELAATPEIRAAS